MVYVVWSCGACYLYLAYGHLINGIYVEHVHGLVAGPMVLFAMAHHGVQ